MDRMPEDWRPSHDKIELEPEHMPVYARMLADADAAWAEYLQTSAGIETAADIKYEPRHFTEARRDAVVEAARMLLNLEFYEREHARAESA